MERVIVIMPTAVIKEIVLLLRWPNFNPRAARIKLNSDIWAVVTPHRKLVLLRYPKSPIIIRTIRGLPISTKSEKTIIGQVRPEKSENTSEEPKITKKIKMKKSLKDLILAEI